MNTTLRIDGNTGEGGGQIIRSALTLSMLTGTPIEVSNIRAGRRKPGLMRQHLVCVQAAQRLSHAQLRGAELGSTALSFSPQKMTQENVAPVYRFEIGSAGSTHLVMQTLWPVLAFHPAFAGQITRLEITGGTHNPLAPDADFIQYGFLPVLKRWGITLDYHLKQAGFMPVGGGEIRVEVHPCTGTDSPPIVNERGQLQQVQLIASCLNLPGEIALRELQSAEVHLRKYLSPEKITTQPKQLKGIGEGNHCYAIVAHEHHQEVFSLLGEKRITAEQMGKRLAGLVRRYLFATTACADEYSADQWLLPLALIGGGQFSARMISEHTKTQAWLIEQFLPVAITFVEESENNTQVRVSARG